MTEIGPAIVAAVGRLQQWLQVGKIGAVGAMVRLIAGSEHAWTAEARLKRERIMTMVIEGHGWPRMPSPWIRMVRWLFGDQCAVVAVIGEMETIERIMSIEGDMRGLPPVAHRQRSMGIGNADVAMIEIHVLEIDTVVPGKAGYFSAEIEGVVENQVSRMSGMIMSGMIEEGDVVRVRSLELQRAAISNFQLAVTADIALDIEVTILALNDSEIAYRVMDRTVPDQFSPRLDQNRPA